MTPESGLEVLDQQYLTQLAKFDQGAVRRKWHYQAMWTTITCLTFANMILAALSEHFSKEPWFDDPSMSLTYKTAANIAFTAIGILIIGLTVAQTTSGLQGRWLSFRAAAERLRRNAMLFRARLAPFDGPDPVGVLRSMVQEISQVAHKIDAGESQGRFSWKYAWALWTMRDHDSRPSPSTPDQGLQGGPLSEEEVLHGRLQNQRRWYVRRARRYFRDYMLMQAGIVGCSVFNVLHAFIWRSRPDVLVERQFWLIVVSSILSLGLIACRDFLDWGPLFVRYLQTATNLGTIEKAYVNREPPFDMPDDAARVKKLAEQVEQTLASEFQYWIYTRR